MEEIEQKVEMWWRRGRRWRRTRLRRRNGGDKRDWKREIKILIS
jgi:hypothetical protein